MRGTRGSRGVAYRIAHRTQQGIWIIAVLGVVWFAKDVLAGCNSGTVTVRTGMELKILEASWSRSCT